jgi:succinate-semialdehyde dehydrogenase / glutarate-semialdehyde dehydrogenase
MLYTSRNPYTQQILAEYPTQDGEQIAAILELMAVERHKNRFFESIQPRRMALMRVAEQLTEHREKFAQLITAEMGKPIMQSRAEIDKCRDVCMYYAEFGDDYLATEVIKSDNPNPIRARVLRQPIGVILQVMPWNFPFWQVFRFAAPALLAGNSIVLKHSPNVPQCALAIANLMAECLQSKYIFCNIFATNELVGRIISSPIIRGVSFTGSNKAGAIIASLAGNATKKTLLELGGSDAFMVCADASINTVVMQAAYARLQNNGQTCIAAKRFIVADNLYDEFLVCLADFVKNLPSGDPLNPNNYLTVLARTDLQQMLTKQVADSIQAGAKAYLLGGADEAQPNSYSPTILTNIPLHSPAATEELFGSVFSVFRAKNEEDAIKIANRSAFGLGASVWSSDTNAALRIAERLNVGSVAINQLVKSDPRLPFGGVKDSGYGRELGREGILEFVNTKTIVY